MPTTNSPGQRGNADRGKTTEGEGNIALGADNRHTDPVATFRAAMVAAGLRTTEPIQADGKLHRVHLEGDRKGSANGWYVLHADEPASGAFGSWKSGVTGTWTAARDVPLTSAERERLRLRAEAARLASEREQLARHEEASGRAREIWAHALPADAGHPYLVAKAVGPGIARQSGRQLVLPVTDLDGRLWSVQFIGPDGGKKLLAGGRKKGNVIPVAGAMPGASRILLCEGWATGQTLATMEPDALVLAAVDAYNLEAVALAVRAHYGHSAEIIVCCDADPVGVLKGRAAAVAAGGMVSVPKFPPGAKGSDYNDLAAVLREVAS